MKINYYKINIKHYPSLNYFCISFNKSRKSFFIESCLISLRFAKLIEKNKIKD